ncbi:MAG TPA: hypothetical protein VK668_05180 [Mucilaginibacter sp.]|nr:hypothetical protein [Mucilaginibacter sp.]
MTTIISERHFFKFYISILLFALFWGLLSLATGVLSDQGTTLFGRIMMIAMSAGLAFMVFYTIFRYYKNAPRIVVNDNSIAFNSKVYYWRDLEKIEMTGKRPFKFMGERKEGVVLKFKGEKERYIFDDMYENTAQIKSFIQQVIIDKKPFDIISKSEIVFSAIANEIPKYYKGLQFFCYEGAIIWFFILGFLYVLILSINTLNFEFSGALFVLTMPIVIILSFRMYYFGLSENYLVVRNHDFFWVKKFHQISNIKEVVFEQRHNMPVSLRVINNDFTSKLYPATTLGSKKWLALKADLESKGVKVRNECVYYEPFKFKFKFFND